MHKGQMTNSAQLAFVLDDDPKVSAIICRILTSAGMMARRFERQVEFLAELRVSNPKLVVLDLALGESDAIDVIRQLELFEFKGMVLLVSGRHESSLLEVEKIGRSHGLCMLPSLQKPFRLDEFSDRLKALNEAQRSEPSKESAPTVRPRCTRMDVEEALKRDWLELWYQPKIDLKSLTICGAEALLRARHPVRGVVQPIDFLPPAGDALYQPLSGFVLRRAMQDWTMFADKGLFTRLSVNIPVSILTAPGFVDLVRKAIPSCTKFPGLIIEVTEDESIHDQQSVYEVATQLKLYNLWLSIDDFGTAYASLSRLQDLPFIELKLDRKFVSDCASDRVKHALCQTVVDLARRFGASCCAEGVETPEDARCLINLGFDTAQGFLFAKPMPAKQFHEAMVTKYSQFEWKRLVMDTASLGAQA